MSHSKRFRLKVDEQQDRTIKAAAKTLGQTEEEFVLSSALMHANEIEERAVFQARQDAYLNSEECSGSFY